ncbi:MAG: cation-translocating P-type ATPase [Candidatus Aminicenantes bacterium]|nr:cation-translocating P-type ATPase [Candidatus Aminicenantes bacterium]
MEEKPNKLTYVGRWYSHPPLRNALLAGLLTGTGFGLAHGGVVPALAEKMIYAVAILLGGFHWGREGLEGLFREKEIGIEILMLGATFGSAVLGMWDEAAFLVFLYGTAEGLEEYTYAKTRHSIQKLLDLAPKEARVLRNGREEAIPAEELKVGEIFIVRPGESVPTDGVIVKGRSSVNEAPVTGESIPVEKKPGMKVYAATMNQEGALEIKSTAAFEENTLSKMIHLVEEAQEQKGKAQLFIDKFSRKYSPLVLLTALLLTVMPLFLGAPISLWATKAVVLLVAAAPCALVMSTPVAIAAGIGKAGKSGVLIKGGIHLENLGKIKIVAFDKTGTLTKGMPIVTDIMAFNSDKPGILSLACSIEKYSEHPLAQAIVKKAEDEGAVLFDAEDFCAIAGYGARAEIGGRKIYVGKEGLFKRLGPAAYSSSPQIDKLRKEGKTVMFIGTEDSIMGLIAIRDEIRPQAKEAINQLHALGIQVAMLTGDNEITARAIADELGIDDVKADLKPEYKIEAIKELERKFGACAMVGDGINDAPALARATVGIAMGVAGTDAALEAADVALMADDLTKVSYAINLGKKAKRISNQNIVFSLLVLIALIPSALVGLIDIAIAVFSHEASELLAVANGLRVAKK